MFEVKPVRILLPAPLDDNKLYDVAIALPETDSAESNSDRILQAIREHFGVVVTREELLLHVYVVNTGNGKAPVPLTRSDDDRGGGASFSRVEIRTPIFEAARAEIPSPVKPASLGDIQAISLEGTIDEFCRTLEYGLDRPMVNETNLAGEYAFHLNAGTESRKTIFSNAFAINSTSASPRSATRAIVVLKPR